MAASTTAGLKALLRRPIPPAAPFVLLAVVVVADALIHVLALPATGPGGALLAALDEPAHLSTAALILLNLGRPRLSFVLAALASSVLIDLDHVLLELHSAVLTHGTPRPHTHSLGGAALLGLAALLISRRPPIAAGVLCGVLMHLFRDLATGPGVPLLWPWTLGTARFHWAIYAGVLAALAIGAHLRLKRTRRSLDGYTNAVPGEPDTLSPGLERATTGRGES